MTDRTKALETIADSGHDLAVIARSAIAAFKGEG